MFVFFFQAEDGIRDDLVTGVQTCALPISEIFQEGVRIPPIRVIDRGRPNDAALDLIFANMRGPRERRGDYHAMIGTCRKAAERVEALAARYGAGTVRAAVAELMDRAEGRMRRAIAALPDGEYRY